MTPDQANRMVAATLSEAMAHCKSNPIDGQTVRTGLLTITIANFVNRIGKEHTMELFRAIPDQIQSGIFDRYIAQASGQPQTSPQPLQQTPAQNGPHVPHYQSPTLPQNFIPPQSISSKPDHPPSSQPNQLYGGANILSTNGPQRKRRLKG